MNCLARLIQYIFHFIFSAGDTAFNKNYDIKNNKDVLILNAELKKHVYMAVFEYAFYKQ